MNQKKYTYCPFCGRTILHDPERIYSKGIKRPVGWYCSNCSCYIPDDDVIKFNLALCVQCNKTILITKSRHDICPTCSHPLDIIESFNEYHILRLIKSDIMKNYGNFNVFCAYNNDFIQSFEELKKKISIRTRQKYKRKYGAISSIYD